jgi:hypothetical protein
MSFPSLQAPQTVGGRKHFKFPDLAQLPTAFIWSYRLAKPPIPGRGDSHLVRYSSEMILTLLNTIRTLER